MISFAAAEKALPRQLIFSPEDVERTFGVTYTPEQRARLEFVPFGKDLLRRVGGLLFPGFPLDLLETRRRQRGLFPRHGRAWYERGHRFARMPLRARWYLLGGEPVPGSHDKSLDEQVAMLAPGERIPTACEVAYGVVLHAVRTGSRLFAEQVLRTVDTTNDGLRVSVWVSEARGLVVGPAGWDDDRDGQLCITVCHSA